MENSLATIEAVQQVLRGVQRKAVSNDEQIQVEK